MTTSAFVFQNQHNQFLNKSGEWVDGSESQTLLKTLFKDEALNIKAEHSVKQSDLRLSIVNCELNAKGHPQVKISIPNTAPSSTPLQDKEDKEAASECLT